VQNRRLLGLVMYTDRLHGLWWLIHGWRG
jgi:hypothetical protein